MTVVIPISVIIIVIHRAAVALVATMTFSSNVVGVGVVLTGAIAFICISFDGILIGPGFGLGVKKPVAQA